MTRYRCFCMTEDDRIITGAVVETDYVDQALNIVVEKWRDVPGFASVQLWSGSTRLYPRKVPALPRLEIAGPISSGFFGMTGHGFEISAPMQGWILERQVTAGGGQPPFSCGPVIATRKPD